jgi:hypothetical protein
MLGSGVVGRTGVLGAGPNTVGVAGTGGGAPPFAAIMLELGEEICTWTSFSGLQCGMFSMGLRLQSVFGVKCKALLVVQLIEREQTWR